MVHGVNSSAPALQAVDADHQLASPEAKQQRIAASSGAEQSVSTALAKYDPQKAAKMLQHHQGLHPDTAVTLSVAPGLAGTGSGAGHLVDMLHAVTDLIKKYEPQLLGAFAHAFSPHTGQARNSGLQVKKHQLPAMAEGAGAPASSTVTPDAPGAALGVPAHRPAVLLLKEVAEEDDVDEVQDHVQSSHISDLSAQQLDPATYKRLQAAIANDDSQAQQALPESALEQGKQRWREHQKKQETHLLASSPHELSVLHDSAGPPTFDDIFPEHRDYTEADFLAAYKVFNALMNMAMANCLDLVGSQNSAQSDAAARAYAEANPMDLQQAMKAEAELHHLHEQTQAAGAETRPVYVPAPAVDATPDSARDSASDSASASASDSARAKESDPAQRPQPTRRS